MKRAIVSLGILAAIAACQSETAPGTAMPGMPGMTAAAPMTAAMPGLPATASAPVAQAEPTQAEVPVAEDFEEEATTTVQEQNYRAELDRIAREIETSQ